MKKIIVFFFFIFTGILFAQNIEFEIIKDSYLCDNSSIYKEKNIAYQGIPIYKGTKILYTIGDDYVIAPYETNNIYSCYYVTTEKGQEGYIIMDDCQVLSSEKLLEKYSSKILEKCWISKYSFDVFESNSINKLFEYEPYWKMSWKTSTGEKWTDINCLTQFIMNEKYIYFYCYEGTEGRYLVTSAEQEGKYIKLELFSQESVYLSGDKDVFLSKMATPGKYTLYLKFDGDYLTLYLNDYNTSPLVELAFTDNYMSLLHKNTAIAKNEKITLDDIKWPRHADGTCDYDGSAKPAGARSIPSAPSSSAISLSGTAKRVTTNLRLRNTEDTSSTVITTMQKGTSVKIIKTGSQDTIDGITSNWVQVEVQTGAKDRNGKSITAGTTGWCFGGYLE